MNTRIKEVNSIARSPKKTTAEANPQPTKRGQKAKSAKTTTSQKVITAASSAPSKARKKEAPPQSQKLKTGTAKSRPPKSSQAEADTPGSRKLIAESHGEQQSEKRDQKESNTGRGFFGNEQAAEFDRIFSLWRSSGDPMLRERLILMHRPLVAYVARRFMDRGEQFDDIMQQGVIALIHALDQFDPQRGVRFATFATPTIVGELRRYFRDRAWSIRVPRRMQEMLPVINVKIEALTQELNRSPTYAEIARSLNFDVEEVAEALELSHTIDPLSLDDYVPSEAGAAPVTVADQIGGLDLALEEWIDYTALKTALDKLPEKQRRVLQLAYFQGYSQMEIARTMKVSQMHISRLQRRALSQLRELMEG